MYRRRVFPIAILLLCSLLALVRAGHPSPPRSALSRTGENSSSVVNDPSHALQTPAEVAFEQLAPSTTSRGGSRGGDKKESNSALLPVETPAWKKELSRQQAKRTNDRRKKLGLSTYFNLRPEHKLGWRPPYLANKSRHQINVLRKQMLGFQLREPLPEYAHFLPWKLIERVQTRRLQEPDTPIQEMITTERDKWEEEIRLMNVKDPLAGRSEEEILRAKDKALRIRRQTQRRRVVERKRPEPNKPRRNPFAGMTQVDILAAIPGELHPSKIQKRRRRRVAAADDVGSSISASESPVKKQKVLPFDLNLSASGGESTGSQ